MNFKKNFYDKKFCDSTIKLLRDVTLELEKNSIDYYLDFGTLLGAIRDKKLIPWDNDVDITILNPKDFNRVYKVLKSLNYSIKTITFKESNENRVKKNRKIYYNKLNFTAEKNLQIIKVKKKFLFGLYSARLDIFFKYEKDGYLNFVADGKKYRVESHYLKDGLTKIDFYGYKFSVPKNYNSYLEAVYGNWKMPDSKLSKEECLTLVKEKIN
jgi:phosphorylcholine metabolism protein LicD